MSSPAPATTSRGSVQQGLSVAGGDLDLFQPGRATDKRYSLGFSMNKPFQRVGSKSNSQVGSDFERIAQQFFASSGVELERSLKVEVGIGSTKKLHAFDLGCAKRKWLIECKSHCWTTGHNIPSAKLTVWNEAMYYFHVAPPEYKKILFVLKDLRRETGESLSSYYLRTHAHLVPPDVEVWEYDELTKIANQVHA